MSQQNFLGDHLLLASMLFTLGDLLWSAGCEQEARECFEEASRMANQCLIDATHMKISRQNVMEDAVASAT